MSDYIICYDITDPRRLQRVHRCLKRRATPLQYSVFLYRGSERQLLRHLAELEDLMDPRSDDVRAYPLPVRGLRLILGQLTLPEGVFWKQSGDDWQPPEPLEAPVLLI